MRPRDFHWRELEVVERMVPARGIDAVAALLGRRRAEVRAAVRCRRRMTEDEAVAAATMFTTMGAEDVARALGCSPEEVVASAEIYGAPGRGPRQFRRSDLPRSSSPWSAADDATLRRMAAAGHTARAVAAALGRTRGMVLGRAWRLGIAWTGGDA